VALTRAARLYQDALWMIESEPSLAWLLLVSAIETAFGMTHSQRTKMKWLRQTEKGRLEADPIRRIRAVSADP